MRIDMTFEGGDLHRVLIFVAALVGEKNGYKIVQGTSTKFRARYGGIIPDLVLEKEVTIRDGPRRYKKWKLYRVEIIDTSDTTKKDSDLHGFDELYKLRAQDVEDYCYKSEDHAFVGGAHPPCIEGMIWLAERKIV